MAKHVFCFFVRCEYDIWCTKKRLCKGTYARKKRGKREGQEEEEEELSADLKIAWGASSFSSSCHCLQTPSEDDALSCFREKDSPPLSLIMRAKNARIPAHIVCTGKKSFRLKKTVLRHFPDRVCTWRPGSDSQRKRGFSKKASAPNSPSSPAPSVPLQRI